MAVVVATDAPGCFGKLPGRGDFVRTPDQHALMLTLDRWAGGSIELLARNPADLVKAPRVEHKEMQALTPEQILQFLAAAKWELFDLAKDWTQSNDVAAENPEKLAQMVAKLQTREERRRGTAGARGRRLPTPPARPRSPWPRRPQKRNSTAR